MDALVQWSTGNAWLHPVSVDATAAIHHEITESTTVQPEEEGKRIIQHWYDHNGEIHLVKKEQPSRVGFPMRRTISIYPFREGQGKPSLNDQ